MYAIEISTDWFVGGGVGADLTFGWIKGKGPFVAVTGRTGVGFDVTPLSVTGQVGWFSGPEEERNMDTYSGGGAYANIGVSAVTGGGSISMDGRWKMVNAGFAWGSRTVAGGSVGVSYTYGWGGR